MGRTHPTVYHYITVRLLCILTFWTMRTTGDGKPDSMEGYPLYNQKCVLYNRQIKSETEPDLNPAKPRVDLDSISRELCTDHRDASNVPAFLDANYPVEQGQVMMDFEGNTRYHLASVCTHTYRHT
jgi:hypothetical protein